MSWGDLKWQINTQEQKQKKIYGKHLRVNLRQEISIRILLPLQRKLDMNRLQKFS